VHLETIRRWAREGAIPAAKLGNRGSFRFKREALDRFLENRRQGLDAPSTRQPTVGFRPSRAVEG